MLPSGDWVMDISIRRLKILLWPDKSRDYEKYILKTNVEDKCRKACIVGENVEHIMGGWSTLAENAYLIRHNACKISSTATGHKVWIVGHFHATGNVFSWIKIKERFSRGGIFVLLFLMKGGKSPEMSSGFFFFLCWKI